MARQMERIQFHKFSDIICVCAVRRSVCRTESMRFSLYRFNISSIMHIDSAELILCLCSHALLPRTAIGIWNWTNGKKPIGHIANASSPRMCVGRGDCGAQCEAEWFVTQCGANSVRLTFASCYISNRASFQYLPFLVTMAVVAMVAAICCCCCYSYACDCYCLAARRICVECVCMFDWK